jgi:hypothetical protein
MVSEIRWRGGDAAYGIWLSPSTQPPSSTPPHASEIRRYQVQFGNIVLLTNSHHFPEASQTRRFIVWWILPELWPVEAFVDAATPAGQQLLGRQAEKRSSKCTQ